MSRVVTHVVTLVVAGGTVAQQCVPSRHQQEVVDNRRQGGGNRPMTPMAYGLVGLRKPEASMFDVRWSLVRQPPSCTLSCRRPGIENR